MIDMAELVWLQICEELDDTWVWVASRLERRPNTVAPQPPRAAAQGRTIEHRLARLEEDVYILRGALDEQREVLDSMACDFSPFTTWMVTRLSRMMDHVRVRYTSYSDLQIPYVRLTRHRTDDVGTSAPQQPDP
nr:hypothetical protein [Tanacetum cinerariifolium]